MWLGDHPRSYWFLVLALSGVGEASFRASYPPTSRTSPLPSPSRLALHFFTAIPWVGAHASCRVPWSPAGLCLVPLVAARCPIPGRVRSQKVFPVGQVPAPHRAPITPSPPAATPTQRRALRPFQPRPLHPRERPELPPCPPPLRAIPPPFPPPACPLVAAPPPPTPSPRCPGARRCLRGVRRLLLARLGRRLPPSRRSWSRRVPRRLLAAQGGALAPRPAAPRGGRAAACSNPHPHPHTHTHTHTHTRPNSSPGPPYP